MPPACFNENLYAVTAELEIARSFGEFEAKHAPYTIQVRGVSLWRLLRVAVGYAMQKLPLSLTSVSRSQLIIATAKSAGSIVWQPSLAADYMVKSYASALRVKGAHGYEDIYFEELLKDRPNGVRLHSLNASGYANRRHGLGTASIDCTAIHTAGAALGRFFPIKEGNEAYARLSGLITKHLGVAGFSAQQIAATFASFWWQARLFKRLLASSSVNTVIAADSEERALAYACQGLGIRFVELQHGVLNPLDPLCLPATALRQANARSLLLPDLLALYGDYWAERHAATAMGNLGRLATVGASSIDRYHELRAKGFQADPVCPRLVVTTQGLDRDALIAFLDQFLNLHAGACVVTIKLHPAYDRSAQPYVKVLSGDPRVEIVMGDAQPNTFELLAKADLHISIASACHYDALGIGTPTAVLNLKGSDAVQDLVRKGDALYLNTPADLANLIVQRSWGKVDAATSGQYFKQNHLRNMLALLH